MKSIALFTAFFVLSFPLFSNSQSLLDQKIQTAVKAAEASWNATSPDKSYLSEGNAMQYGLDYLKAGNYTSASWSFEEVLKKNSNNAYANFFMGCIKLGLNNKAAANQYLEKAAGLDASLKQNVAVLAAEAGAKPNNSDPKHAQSGTADTKQTNASRDTKPAAQADLNHYKVGDKVEVMHADGWWPGVVTKVEGENKSVYVTVDYSFQGSKYNASFFYNGVRPATGNTATYQPANKPGNALVYGDYTLSRGLGLSATPVGFFTMYADGTYKYFDVKGTYTYSAATGVITWKSGTFYNWGKNTSTFTRGKRVSQIDMTYPQKAGPLYYSAGHNN